MHAIKEELISNLSSILKFSQKFLTMGYCAFVFVLIIALK